MNTKEKNPEKRILKYIYYNGADVPSEKTMMVDVKEQFDAILKQVINDENAVTSMSFYNMDNSGKLYWILPWMKVLEMNHNEALYLIPMNLNTLDKKHAKLLEFHKNFGYLHTNYGVEDLIDDVDTLKALSFFPKVDKDDELFYKLLKQLQQSRDWNGEIVMANDNDSTQKNVSERPKTSRQMALEDKKKKKEEKEKEKEKEEKEKMNKGNEKKRRGRGEEGRMKESVQKSVLELFQSRKPYPELANSEERAIYTVWIDKDHGKCYIRFPNDHKQYETKTENTAKLFESLSLK